MIYWDCPSDGTLTRDCNMYRFRSPEDVCRDSLVLSSENLNISNGCHLWSGFEEEYTRLPVRVPQVTVVGLTPSPYPGGRDPVAPLNAITDLQDNRFSPSLPNPNFYVPGYFKISP